MGSSTTNKPHLPITRINTIMKSSSEADKISKESSYMMTKATELFIRILSQQGYKLTNNGKKLDYKHLAEVVNREDRYEFIRDIMPKKITVLEFKEIMERKKNSNNKSSASTTSESSSDDNDDDESDCEAEEENKNETMEHVPETMKPDSGSSDSESSSDDVIEDDSSESATNE